MHLPKATTSPDMIAALTDLAERQFGIARRAQLVARGMSSHAVDAELSARRWQALNPLVVAMHNGPLTLQQKWSAAVLSAEGPACLAGRTAAHAAGLVGWEVDPIHVLVRRGAKVNDVAGVPIKVHESRRFEPTDIHRTRTPPQVSIERALIDAAVWSTAARTACGLLAAGVQQRKTSASRLQVVLEGAGRVRHRRLLLAVLRDIDGGAQAVSELDFLRFCQRNRLPRPALQVRLDARGRRRYLDATFRRADGKLIGVEIDGAAHLVVGTYWSDMIRQNDIVIGGRRVLRFPSAFVYANDQVAVSQLRSALRLPTSLSERRPPMAG